MVKLFIHQVNLIQMSYLHLVGVLVIPYNPVIDHYVLDKVDLIRGHLADSAEVELHFSSM
jgi:hypothetical protein